MKSPRIVIVGAGFAGTLSAKRLAKKFGSSVDVLLLNRTDHFLFAPRLIDVLQDRFEHLQFRAELNKLAKRYNFRFLKARVTSIDRTAKQVTYVQEDGASETVDYDVVIVSPGATTNYYNTPGAKEFAMDLKTFESVVQIREQVIELFERAKQAKSDVERRHILCFSVIGGGASGVEAMFALKVHVERYAATHAPELLKFLSFILVQAAPQILPGFPDAIVDGVIAQIHRQGVSMFISEPVVRITETGFETAHGRMVPSGLVLWCAGLAAPALAVVPEVAKDPAGFILTDRSLRIDDSTFAAGDAISFRDNLVLVPKNGQTARLMALTLVENVIRTIQKRPLKYFHYRSKGTLLIIGKTGFLDLRLFVLKSRWLVQFRDFFYRALFKDIAT